jgi:hypothetical protein
VKLAQAPLSQRIANFDELRDAFAHTAFAAYFDDSSV